MAAVMIDNGEAGKRGEVHDPANAEEIKLHEGQLVIRFPRQPNKIRPEIWKNPADWKHRVEAGHVLDKQLMELLKKTTGFHLVKYDSTRSLFVAKEHSVGQSNEQEHLKNREVRMRKLLPKNNPNWVDALQLLKSENK